MYQFNRRQFIKSLAVGGIALMHGCSEDQPSKPKPNNSPPDTTDNTDPVPSWTTPIALYKTKNHKEGVTKLMELLDFPSVQGKNVLLKPNFNTSDPFPGSTHNDTLSQIILELQARNANNVTVVERSYQSFNTMAQEKGLHELLNPLNVELVN